LFKINSAEVSNKEAWLDLGSMPDDPLYDKRSFEDHKYRAFDKY